MSTSGGRQADVDSHRPEQEHHRPPTAGARTELDSLGPRPGSGPGRRTFRIFHPVTAGPRLADYHRVGAMRARLMMKVMSLLVMLVLTVMGARSCSGSSASSPLNPATVISNGLGGLCANQQAAADAGGLTGDPSAQTLQIPADRSQLAQAATAAGFTGGSFACPTTTTTPPSGY